MSRPVRRFHPWTWARRTTALGFLALLFLGRYDFFPWFKGSTSATRAFGWIPFSDPLAALEVTLATRQMLPSVWIGAALLLSLTLVLGPVFCGWICPLGLVLDLGQSLRRRVRGRFSKKLPHRPERGLPRGSKYVVLASLVGFAIVARTPVFQIVSPINILARALVFSVDVALFAVLALLFIEVFAPRLWCRSLCPLGALYGLVGRKSLLRIRVDPARAGQIRCQRCDAACPLGIRVMEDYPLAGKSSIDHPDCTRCGSCTEVCPNGVLRLGFRDLPEPEFAPQPCPMCESDGACESAPSAPPRKSEAVQA